MKYSVYAINSTNFKFVTVRKEIKVEVASDDEWEALRTKRGLPTSVSTRHRGPLVVSRNGLLLCVQFVFTTLNNSLLFLVPLGELSRELRVINYNLRKNCRHDKLTI